MVSVVRSLQFAKLLIHVTEPIPAAALSKFQ